MIKKTFFFVLIFLSFSCKEEVVKEPENLIEKEVMVNILYDLSLLEAIKFQSTKPLDTYKITPSQYIYQKYKIDSTQFFDSNKYYASDYKDYKKMNEQINERLDKNKLLIEAQIKKENEDAVLRQKAKSKLRSKGDSLVK